MNTEREELTFDYEDITDYSPSAYLVVIGDKEYFLPKNHCIIDCQDETIELEKWLAIEIGLV